jgi:thiol-disulfide isomerase/thioredoxin
MRYFLMTCLALALSACHKPSGPASNETGVAAPAAEDKGPDESHKGQAAPPVLFTDPDGHGTTLKAFLGKPTLVNLWASWCAPCITELPTLDRLASARAGTLNVVAISQDMAPHASVEAFLNAHRIDRLAAYQDSKMGLSGALNAEVLPTSVLYDSNGKEVWRYVGDLDWTSPKAARLLDQAGAGRGS